MVVNVRTIILRVVLIMIMIMIMIMIYFIFFVGEGNFPLVKGDWANLYCFSI